MEKAEIEQLLEEIKRGSIERYEQIIDHFQQPIFTYCYHMLDHRQEAEDAVQEVLLKAYEHLDQYTYSLSFSAWLYKIAFHHCANLLKRRRLARMLPFLYKSEEEGRSYVDDFIDQNYLSEPLQIVWSKLSGEERSILIFRVLEGREYEEISGLMNKQPAALRKQYERTLKKCKRYLDRTGGMIDEAQRFY